MKRGFFLALLGLFLLSLPGVAAEKTRPATPLLSRIRGIVEYRKSGEKEWGKAHERMPLRVGDSLRTGDKSSAVITWSRNNHSVMGPKSTVVITGGRTRTVTDEKEKFLGFLSAKAEKQDIMLLQVEGGMGHRLEGLRANSSFRVVTPVAVTGVRGTEWFSHVAHEPNMTGYTFISVTNISSENENVTVTFFPEGAAPGGPAPFTMTFSTPLVGSENRLIGWEGITFPSPDFVGAGSLLSANAEFGVLKGEVEASTIFDRTAAPLIIPEGKSLFVRGFGPPDGSSDIREKRDRSGVQRDIAPEREAELRNDRIIIRDLLDPRNRSLRGENADQEQSSSERNLSNLRIGGSNLKASLLLFVLGARTFDDLDSSHPIENGSLSWRNFTRDEIHSYKNTLP